LSGRDGLGIYIWQPTAVDFMDRMRCDTNITLPATCGALWGMRELIAFRIVDNDIDDADLNPKQGFVDDFVDDWITQAEQPKEGEFCEGTCFWGFKSEEDCIAFYRPSPDFITHYYVFVSITASFIFLCACSVLACCWVPRDLSTGSCAGDFFVVVGQKGYRSQRRLSAGTIVQAFIQVTVPANASAGNELNVPLPDGRTVRVVVPPSTVPGSILTVEVPPPVLTPRHKNAAMPLPSSGGGDDEVRSAASAGVSDLDALESAGGTASDDDALNALGTVEALESLTAAEKDDTEAAKAVAAPMDGVHGPARGIGTRI